MLRFERVFQILFIVLTLLQGALLYRYTTHQSELAVSYSNATILIREQSQLIELQHNALLEAADEIYQLKHPPSI
jgi:hypothetical protein